jgi:peptidoglycan/LPS O-acetylase OafA/YrhL
MDMKTRSLKSLLKYWQEIVFIISIGILLFEIAKFNLVQNSIDVLDIALLSLILPLFICLIGQLYWNNKTLSIVLSAILSIASFILILMAFYFMATTSSKLLQAFTMLILGIFLLFAGLTMPGKNRQVVEDYR